MLFDARLPIVKVNETLGVALSTLNHNTLSGLALAHFGRLPEIGDHFVEQGHEFTVVDANDRMILRIAARPLALGKQ